ncbi:YlxM family DNA-binding protein [uncultured Mitsuokella sp.]|uniref:YlxM family DNA-binding protein n=1 Tax=uncultured Mitsuokella sp. TaxID=453120 RepID=UPI00267094E6|nr:YlxM family DNA-binding protein [uncultured Mitsuokella sp.]
MEQLLYLSALFDFYGALLTEKQQECLKMHLFEDFSLSEIGEELGISRQAVYDNIHRSEKAMESYEGKLGLVARYQRERAVLAGVCKSVQKLRTPKNSAAVDDVLARLVPLLGSSRDDVQAQEM